MRMTVTVGRSLRWGRTSLLSVWLSPPSHRVQPLSCPALWMAHRTCAAASSSSPAAPPIAAAAAAAAVASSPPPPRRRSKRFSYADADRVYASQHANAATTDNTTAAAATAAAASSAPAGVSSLLLERATQHGVQQRTGPLHRLRRRAQQQWQVLLLTLLRLPYAGAVVVRLLEASAYAAYVKGSVTLFTRLRVSPPLPSHQSSNAEQKTAASADENTSSAGAAAAATTSSSPSLPPLSAAMVDAPLLQAHALPCLYIGQSDIHSRGLFTSAALPRGTRILAEPHRSLLLSPHFLTLLADTHEKLPDTWHYTQPTGSVVELVTQAQPHHLMNHSCAANVCSGLSRVFWEAAVLAAERQPRQHQEKTTTTSSASSSGTCAVDLRERLTQWPCFADANSFFLTRDVAAGEELTLNYSTRMAPLYAGESRHGVKAQAWLLCRCGAPCCRHYVYRGAPEAVAFLQSLRRHHKGHRSSSDVPRSTCTRQHGDTVAAARHAAEGVCDPLHVVARLLELGFDDELVLLSYAGRPADVVAYVYGHPLPSFTSSSGVSEGMDCAQRRVSKRELLLSYRHVFHLLNEAVPTPHTRSPK